MESPTSKLFALSCHLFNEAAQLYQLKRGYEYEMSRVDEGEKSSFSPVGFGATCLGMGLVVLLVLV